MLKWIDVVKFIKNGNPAPDRRVVKSEVEWKSILSEEAYRVTREKGTEARFTGEHCAIFEPGLYSCVCCETPLFDSATKYESGTGWPSFSEPVAINSINYISDLKFGMKRVEVLCNTCDAHLGHVFPDGPDPSGLRYCINSISLIKHTEDEK